MDCFGGAAADMLSMVVVVFVVEEREWMGSVVVGLLLLFNKDWEASIADVCLVDFCVRLGE